MKAARIHRGFTIVELLVVISIIAMLSAILLPAVNSARAAARQVQCINNMGQLAKAVSSYVATKDQFPNYVSGGSDATRIGWVYAILPNLEKQPIRDEIDLRRQNVPTQWPLTTANIGNSDYYISGLVCPDDTVKSSDSRFGLLSYAANAGLRDCMQCDDCPSAASTYCGPTGVVDWRDNGVFGRKTDEPGSAWGQYVAPKLSLSRDYISSHDGNSTTILFAENVRATTWTAEANENLAAFMNKQTVVWDERGVQISGGATQGTVPLNDKTSSNPPAWYQQSPSSYHAGGFVIAYCDARVQYMSDLIDYTVYARAMTPNGSQARRPGNRTVADRPATYNYQSIVLSERELQP